MLENTDYEEDSYGMEDLFPAQRDEGIYKPLKHLAAVANNDQTPQEDTINFASFLDAQWSKVNDELSVADGLVAQSAAAQGNVDVASLAVQSVRDRLSADYAARKPERDKLQELSDAAVQRIVAANQRVLSLHSVDVISNATKQVASEVTSAVSLNKKIEEGTSWTNVGQMVGRYLVPFLSSAENIGIDQVAKKYVPAEDVSFWGGTSDTRQALQSRFKTVDDDKKADWLISLFDDLDKSDAISSYQAASIIKEILQGEEPGTIDLVFDKVNKVIPFLEVFGVGIAARFTGKGLAAAAKMNSVERAIAKSGGKNILIGEQATKMAIEAAKPLGKELTGVAAVESIVNLASASAKALMPASVKTAVTDVQNVIIDATQDVLNKLKTTVGVEGLPALKQIDDIQKKFSPAVNPNISSLDFTATGATILMKPADASNFLSKEAAEAFVKAKDPTGALKLEVVPDTTNNGYLVAGKIKKDTETALATAIAEKALLEKQLTGATKPVKPTTEASKPLAAAIPRALETSKPRFSAGPINYTTEWDSLLDKAIYQVGSKTNPSKSDVEILEWIKQQTNLDTAAIRTQAGVIRERLKKLAVSGDAVSTENIRVPVTTKQVQEMVNTTPVIKPNVVESVGSSDENEKLVLQYLGTGKQIKLKDGTEVELVWLQDRYGAEGDNAIVAVTKQGKPIGEIFFVFDPTGKYQPVSDVIKEYQRKGLATAMYDLAEELGAKFTFEGGVRTTEGRAFREARERTKQVQGMGETWTAGKMGFSAAEMFLPSSGSRVLNNVAYSATVPMEATQFVETLGKRLGITGKYVVANVDDVVNNPDKFIRTWSTSTALRGLKSKAMFFIGDDGIPVILVNNRLNKTTTEWVESFAHEFGHLFEHKWGTKYSATLSNIFNDFLKTRGIKSIDDITLKGLLEFRSFYAAQDVLRAGSASNYLKQNPQTATWLKLYSEFFAENFAKWSLTDEVPTTILGQTFKAITDGIKEILSSLVGNATWAAKYLQPNERVAKLLNDHIATHKGMAQVKSSELLESGFSMAVASGRSEIERLKDLDETITHLTEQLVAMRDADATLHSGYLVKQNLELPIMKFTNEDIASMSRFSMSDHALGTSEVAYAERVVTMQQQERLGKVLTQYVRKSTAGLSKKEISRVNDVLVRGDAEGKEFNYSELLGMDLTPKEIQAYSTFRTARNITYVMRNEAAVKSLNRRGYVSIANDNLYQYDGVMGRVVTEPTGGIYMAHEGKQVRKGENFTEQYPDVKLYELAAPITVEGKKYWNVGLQINNTVEGTITKAINYRPGEYRRVYTDEYFLKFSYGAGEKMIAHRTAKSAKEANAYAVAFNKALELHRAGTLDLPTAARLLEPYNWSPENFIAAATRGDFDTVQELKAVYTRTDDNYLDDSIFISQGMSSKRGEDAVTSITGEANTLNPLESLSSEISNAAYMYSITDWRDAQILRWYNTFKDNIGLKLKENLNLDINKLTPEQAFTKYVNPDVRGPLVGGTQVELFQQRVEDYILQQLRVPTMHERRMIGTARAAYEWLDQGLVGKALDKEIFGNVSLGKGLRHFDSAPDMARKAAFYSYFSYDPGQFLMQAMNAFNAIAVNPVYGAAAAKTTPAYMIAAFSNNEAWWRSVGKVNRATLGMPVDEFVETMRLLKRSGMFDVNYGMLHGDLSQSASVTGKWMQGLASSATGFFRLGEESGRVLAFDIALRDWKAKNPGKAWWTDEAAFEILKRQDVLNQNLHNANVATYQKGILAVPFQFYQYPIKFATNVFNTMFLGGKRNLTRAEVSRMLAIHAITFGTAGAFLGIPGIDEAVGVEGAGTIRDDIAETVSELGLSKEATFALQQGGVAGIINYLSLAMTGEETMLAIGSRFSTTRQFEDMMGTFVKSLFTPDVGQEQPGVFEVAFGASAGAFNRGRDVFSRITALYTDITPEVAPSVIRETGFQALTQISIVNRFDQIYFRNGIDAVFSKSGNKLYSMSEKEAFFKAVFNVDPPQASELKGLFENQSFRKTEEQRIAKRISDWRLRALTAMKNGDLVLSDHYSKLISIQIAGINDLELKGVALSASFKTEVNTKHQELIQELLLANRKTGDVLVTNKPTSPQAGVK